VVVAQGRNIPIRIRDQRSLVLLFSWKFFNQGYGSFRELMQRLDVAMTGTIRDDRKPQVLDTGHIPVKLQNRDGVEEQVLYRGPLVPTPLSRDALGPYHCADQARRVSVEAGAEDVSYAAAFEAGRLLAAADGRLAQELLRWRQDGYRQSVRADSLTAVSAKLGISQVVDFHTQVEPVLAGVAIQRVLEGIGPLGDPYGLGAAKAAPGLNPSAVQQAWGLGNINQAAAILGHQVETATPSVDAPVATIRVATNIDIVAADGPTLGRLAAERDRVVANAKARVEGQP
jgi:hypothetical protein